MAGDIVSKTVRRRMMQAVRRRDTEPELAVRRIVARIGIRHRRSGAALPGSPDVANISKRWAIFVHGCFWHGHPNCRKTKGGTGGRIPASNREFWAKKIAANRERDARKSRQLRQREFRVLIVWECQSRDAVKLERTLNRFFSKVASPKPPRKRKKE